MKSSSVAFFLLAAVGTIATPVESLSITLDRRQDWEGVSKDPILHHNWST